MITDKELERVIEILGRPVMSYVPEIAIKEYDKKIEEAVKILLAYIKEQKVKEKVTVEEIEQVLKKNGTYYADGRSTLYSFTGYAAYMSIEDLAVALVKKFRKEQ